MKHKWLTLLILVATIVLDQLTKIWVRKFFMTSGPLYYFGDVLGVMHSENTGAFLSLGADMSDALRFWVFTVGVAGFLLAAVVYLLRKNSLDSRSSLALTLMISGGIGNLIDRADHGSVTDFLHLGYGVLQTGVFNVADMAITGGTLYLFLSSFGKKKA